MNLRPGRHERNTFKQIFLSTAAASSLLLAVAAIEPAVFSWATKAQAATNVSASINFYDELAPYGNWVLYHERYVWIPEGVDNGWQPYTKGRWAYTRPHGWIWMSDEKFGWATYHYGRWGKAPDIGWYWLPGGIWAPAWVAWTYDNYDIAWAPLPADYSDDYDDVNIDIPFSEIPDDHWQALSVSGFLSEDLSGHLFSDRDKVRRVIERGKPWTVSIENNIVVNNVLTIDNIEKRTKKKVVALEEKAVDNPDAAGKADGTSVAIFTPEVKEEPNARPKKIAKIEEVVKAREASVIQAPAAPKPAEAATAEEAPKKAEEPANTRRKGKPQCDPTVADCPPAQTLSKPKNQSTKRVLPMTNFRGAESWRINCSPRFGGFTKASETYLSSAGKRVSCVMRPKNAPG